MSDKYDEMANKIVSARNVQYARDWDGNLRDLIAAAIRKAVAEAKREFGEECAKLVEEEGSVEFIASRIRAKVAEIQ